MAWMHLIRSVRRVGLTPCGTYVPRDTSELHGRCEIPRRSQLSGRCSLVGAVFLFEQTATFIPYLFPALPDLKCIFPISPALVAGLFA
jgi:hypothetical protein